MQTNRWMQLAGLAAIAVGMGLSLQAQAGGLTPAQKKALGTCAACHDLSAKKGKLVGPPLMGIYGRKPSISGVPFAKWDQASLGKWLAAPKSVKPGTAMTFAVPDAKLRADVIKALQALK